MKKHILVIKRIQSIPTPKDNVYTNLLNDEYTNENDSVCSVVLCVLDNVTPCLLLIPWTNYDTFKYYAEVGNTLPINYPEETELESTLNDIFIQYITKDGMEMRILGTCIIGTEREIKQAYLELCLLEK